MNLQEIIVCIFLGLGLFFIIIAAVGVLKLPDFYSRLHASGIGETLGLLLFGVGLAINAGFSGTTIKILIVVVAVAIATPIGTHTIGRSAFKSGKTIWRRGSKAVEASASGETERKGKTERKGETGKSKTERKGETGKRETVREKRDRDEKAR